MLNLGKNLLHNLIMNKLLKKILKSLTIFEQIAISFLVSLY